MSIRIYYLGPRLSVRCPCYRVFFFKKIYENLVGTLKTVRNIEVAVLERCLFREVRRAVYACQQSVSTETSTYTSRQHYIY